MSHALTFIEIEGEQIELLPSRTVLTLIGDVGDLLNSLLDGGSSYSADADGGDANGGDADADGGKNVINGDAKNTWQDASADADGGMGGVGGDAEAED